MDQTVLIATKVSACFNLVVMVFSSLLNPIVFFVCVKSKRLRSTSTFKLLAISSINDFICNLPWNQESFTNAFFDFQSPMRSLFYCRWISVFLQFSCFQLTSWLLVSISADRLLSMTIKKWSKSLFNGPKPVIYALLLAFIIFAINFHEVFTSGFSFDLDGIQIIICYANPDGEIQWYFIMSQVLLYFGYIGPFVLLFIVNSAIIYKATQFERSQKVTASSNTAANLRSIKRKAEMTRTVYSITIFYMITTLPSSIVTGYYYGDLIVLPYGQMIVNIVNAFQSLYQACNFFVLYFTNKLFSQEIKSMLSRSRVGVDSTSNRSDGHDSVSFKNNLSRNSTLKTLDR